MLFWKDPSRSHLATQLKRRRLCAALVGAVGEANESKGTGAVGEAMAIDAVVAGPGGVGEPTGISEHGASEATAIAARGTGLLGATGP